MKFQRIFLAAALLVPAGCLLAGCTRRTNHPATAPVSGSVTYEGKPVAGAAVAFLTPGAPRPAIGTTDANGIFRLTTFQPGDGAIPGEHQVTVEVFSASEEVSLQALEKSAAGEGAITSIEKAMQASAQQMSKSRRNKVGVPRRYASRRTSDLRFKVVDGKNDIQIKLVD